MYVVYRGPMRRCLVRVLPVEALEVSHIPLPSRTFLVYLSFEGKKMV